MRPLAATALALALAACGAGGTPDASPSPAVTTSATTSAGTTPQPATGTATPKPTALATDLADGRHYARLTSYDAAKHTLTLDVVQFLTGEAAEQAAHDDGKEAFDYYIRNENPRLRTLTTAAGMSIVANTLTAGQTGSATKDTAITPAQLTAFLAQGEAQRRVFWLTLKNGTVTVLHEQYLP